MNTNSEETEKKETTETTETAETTTENKEKKEESKESSELQGEPISKYVKEEVSKQLIEFGYSKNVAEKACFYNNNIVEKAIEWIYEHQNDPDFEQEERIVSEKE